VLSVVEVGLELADEVVGGPRSPTTPGCRTRFFRDNLKMFFARAKARVEDIIAALPRLILASGVTLRDAVGRSPVSTLCRKVVIFEGPREPVERGKQGL
jgi:hypothetical protein